MALWQQEQLYKNDFQELRRVLEPDHDVGPDKKMRWKVPKVSSVFPDDCGG